MQSEAAPAAYRSWREGAITEDRDGHAAEGLATRVGFELPQQILREHLDDFVLVSEDDLRDATLHHDRAARATWSSRRAPHRWRRR